MAVRDLEQGCVLGLDLMIASIVFHLYATGCGHSVKQLMC